MKPLQIAALTATIVNVLITLFVLRSHLRTKIAFPFTVWGISLTFWNVSTFFLTGDTTHDVALFWDRVLMAGVIFLPVGLLHLCMAITDRERKGLIAFLYFVHIGFAACLFTDWLVLDVRPLQSSYWAVPGPMMWAYTACYSLESAGIVFTLLQARRTAGVTARRQLNLMLAGTFALIIFGANDMLPFTGRDEYPLTTIGFVPLANLAAIFYAVVIAYSLLQHQFLDVRVRLSRTAAQTIRLLFVFITGLILALAVRIFAEEKFPTFAFCAAILIVLASAVISSLAFPRLFGTGDDSIERRLLGDRFEYQDRVRGFIQQMLWYADLDLLLNDLHEILLRSFRIESYRIILRDETSRTFTTFRAHPDEPARILPELKPQSPMLRYFEWGKGEYLSLGRHHLRVAAGSIEREAGEQLAQFGAQFCFPLASQSEPFGLLLIGKKASDEPFTATDINLLVSLVKNMSLMVNQIRLKSQILQTQELDLLGRMSRGMAHDLNNLLTPIWTLLQLSGETGGGLDEDLLPVARRNIKTMHNYIKEALFFSENLRLDLHPGRFDLVIQHAIDLARTSRKKEIEVISVTPGEVLAEMDEVLMQRLIANLISNAIDASHSGAQIHVHLDRLARPGEQEWLRVRVVDQGEGIPKENLSRILTPYFTTKNRGDETRGFGLGLAICRKIVNLHGGKLSIASVVKRGTTVQVDFPARQPRPAAALVAVPA